ncbi:putative Zn-dependent peptidase [Pullulanibacillus pueri]|uniref:Peptidase M16 n=1 Tax=Pullulanibacillus pueri TaxID=1437324 RepID=A0A8J3ELQ3_9BACL|nr:pitrilysin family protein [Pullulanibacillus pueri]MBM7682537.1 putative Zn-dependent peptidase [Pullulanibacillus pueri]GGH82005.1 peptidase M16 [Pullulanibacillus pueri]
METKRFDQLQETVYHQQLANGLNVYILPKEGFNKTFATFTTKYGSIDNHFKKHNSDEWLNVPDGIAHFLEHKMFEQPDGTDVFQAFGTQGAMANAFTSFTATAYLFSSTSRVEENLQTLIDFVQTPAFTDENVEKEKGIIGQEIRMYDDNPDWRLYFGLIENMYHQQPVKIDIAGTVESIAKITKEHLYDCYRTFYHPSNMVLFIVGPVDPEKIFQLVEDNQRQKDYTNKQAIERKYPEEPQTVAKKEEVLSMPVKTPKCLVGFKERTVHREGEAMLRHELSVQLLLEVLFGKGTENYRTLIEEGLIDDSFSFEYTEEHEFAFSAIGGNTEDPDGFAIRVKDMIDQAKQQALDETAIERARKKRIGSFLKALNSPEFIANQFTRYQFNGMDLFSIVPTLESLSLDELKQVLEEHFHDEGFTKFKVVAK